MSTVGSFPSVRNQGLSTSRKKTLFFEIIILFLFFYTDAAPMCTLTCLSYYLKEGLFSSGYHEHSW
jgi:hypothetical protein